MDQLYVCLSLAYNLRTDRCCRSNKEHSDMDCTVIKLLSTWWTAAVSDGASLWHLCSGKQYYLVVPRHNLSMYGRRAFAVAGPAAWNLLSDDLCDTMLKPPAQ